MVNMEKLLKEYEKRIGSVLSNEDLKNIYIELKELVIKYDLAYRSAKPLITDEEFDDLYIFFENFEKENPDLVDDDSPTITIYETVINKLKKIKHKSFMGSQEKMKTKEELEEFLNKVQSKVSVEHKLDGITVVMRYNNGKLIQAITRGNGTVGEDITHAVVGFCNVPLKVNYKEPFEIRAEAVMNYKDFEKVNKPLPDNEKYSNPRNLVSGTVRNLDGNVAKSRNLRAIVFGITNIDEHFETGLDEYKFLQSLGFDVVNHVMFDVDEKEELFDYVLNFDTDRRLEIPYMIDGLVLKVDNISKREELGEKTKYPNWSSAFKFKSLDASTKLLDVKWNVGKTGKLSPIGIVEKVIIDNVNIQRVTLNNYEWIENMNLKIGSDIIIVRSNDVIPKVISVVDNDENTIDVEEPTTCPICNSQLVKDGVHIFCKNKECSSQSIKQIINWCDKKRLDISGLGIKAIEQLYEDGIVENILDLYTLKDNKDKFLQLERQGEKSFNNAISEIENSINSSFFKVIYGLNIPFVGSTASKTFVETYNSYDIIMNEMKDVDKFRDNLYNLKDFGPVIVESIIDYFSEPSNIETFERLKEIGFKLEDTKKVIVSDSNIKNKSFVITGTLSKPKSYFEEKIENLGGLIKSSVSKNTDYVLVGEKAGSKKTKAEDLGIKMLTEEDFNNLIM